MIRRHLAHRLLAVAFALVCSLAIVGADLDSEAQNSNSGTPAEPSMMQQNTNNSMRPRRQRARRRRARRRRAAARAAATTPAADATAEPPDATAATADTSMSAGTQSGGGTSMGTPGGDHDMSGVFTGTINAPDMSMSGPATITFTTNTFTIDAGGTTQSGTYTAREWPGQIAVSMRFGTELPANIVSVSAKHRGESLTLMSVRGESKKFSFTTGGGGRRGRRGSGGGTAAEPATPATPADPAADTPATPADPAAPARGRRGRRGRATGGNTNMEGNMNTSGNMNENSGMTGNRNMEGNMNSGETGGNTNRSNMNSGRGGRRRGGRTGGNMNSNTTNANNSNTPPPL